MRVKLLLLLCVASLPDSLPAQLMEELTIDSALRKSSRPAEDACRQNCRSQNSA